MSPIQQNTALPKVKVATRLAMANRDLLEADRFLWALANLPAPCGDSVIDEAVKAALLSSAVVSYCRPFGANSGAGIATRQIEISTFTNVDVELHLTLMNLRNKAVAHSDADIVPVQVLDHGRADMLVVAELPFDLATQFSANDLSKQIDVMLGQIQATLHALSTELRAIPGALGPKVRFTFGELARGEPDA